MLQATHVDSPSVLTVRVATPGALAASMRMLQVARAASAAGFLGPAQVFLTGRFICGGPETVDQVLTGK